MAMSEIEEKICKRALQRMTSAEITLPNTYEMLRNLTAELEAAGGEDPRGKAVAFLLFVVLRAAQGRR